MTATLVSRRLLGLAALAALLALAGCSQLPPPEFCEVCDSYADELTADSEDGPDLDVAVERTVLDVHVRGDGTTRYRFRAILEPGDADTLRENSGPVERLRSAVREDHPDGNPTVELDGNAVVVAHDGPTIGKRGVGGVVLVDRFYETDDDRGLRPGVDRLAIHGPPGWTVTRAPEGATVEDGAVVYEAPNRYEATISEGSLVAFAPDDGWHNRVATRATVGRAIGPDVALQTALGAGPAVVGLAALVGALLSLGIAVDDRIPVRALGGVALVAVVALFALGAGGSLLAGTTGVSVPVSPGAAAVVVGAVAFLAGALVGPLYVDREWAAPAIEHGGRLLAVGTLAVLAAFVLLGLFRDAVVVVGLVAPAALFVPLGYSVGVESVDQWVHSPAILLAPFGAVLPSLPADTIPLLFIGALAMPVWALVTAFVGLLLFFGGYAVAIDADPSEFGLPSFAGEDRGPGDGPGGEG